MDWMATGRIDDPFTSNRRYQVIYADPPWVYRDRAEAGKRGVAYKYPLLSDADIAALPVSRIVADDAMLFLWVTWPKLPEVLPVIDAWGFRYRTAAFVWVKRSAASGKLAWGMGSYTRANTEPCLLATRGRPRRVDAGVHQVVEAPLARHSEKPADVRHRIVRLVGDIPRIELFARQAPPGWDVWGNDVPDPSAPLDLEPPPDPRRDAEALRRRLLEHARNVDWFGCREAAEALAVETGALKPLLAKLVREGVLSRRGRTRGTRYTLADGT